MPTRESKPEGCHMDRMGSESTTKGHLLQLPDGRREILSTSPTADALTPAINRGDCFGKPARAYLPSKGPRR